MKAYEIIKRLGQSNKLLLTACKDVLRWFEKIKRYQEQRQWIECKEKTDMQIFDFSDTYKAVEEAEKINKEIDEKNIDIQHWWNKIKFWRNE